MKLHKNVKNHVLKSKRFYTDMNEFEGDGIEIRRQEKRKIDHLMEVGTFVEIEEIKQKIEIISVLAVYENILYDYKGIVQTEEGKKYIYFNHDMILPIEK